MSKIGLIGAECTGKTTLLALLKKYTDVHIIEELVRDIVKEWGYDKPSDVPDIVTAQRAYLDQQIAEQQRHTSFISDRTPLDNSAYMVLYASPFMTANQIGEFLEDAKTHTSYYDLLIYFPIIWDEVVDDGFRNTDLELRRAIDDIIKDLIKTFEAEHLIYTVKARTPEDRIAEVHNVLRHKNIFI